MCPKHLGITRVGGICGAAGSAVVVIVVVVVAVAYIVVGGGWGGVRVPPGYSEGSGDRVRDPQ